MVTSKVKNYVVTVAVVKPGRDPALCEAEASRCDLNSTPAA